jgi:hypothetical protein
MTITPRAPRRASRRKQINCLEDVRRELARVYRRLGRGGVDPKVGNADAWRKEIAAAKVEWSKKASK